MSSLDDLDAAFSALQDNKPKSGNFTRGLKQSWEETKGTGYGIVGLGGALGAKANIPGAEAAKQWGLENAQEKFDASEKLGQETDQLEGIHGVGDAGAYLSHGLGYVAGQAVPSIVTGGVGSLVGKQLVKQGIKRAATEAVAAKIAEQGATRGAVAGAGLASYGQEAGSIYPDMVKEGHDEPGRAALFAIPAAAMDVIPETRIAKGLFGGVERGAETSLLKYAGKEAGKQAGLEAVTEAGQSVIERAAGYKSLTDKEALSDYANSAALGALGGGAAGAVTAPFHGRPPISPDQLNNRMNETSILKPTQGEQLELFPKPPPNVPPGTQLTLFDNPKVDNATAATIAAAAPDARKEMIGEVRGAYEQALGSVGVQASKGQVTKMVGQITSGAQSKEDVATRLDAQVQALAASPNKEDLVRAETLAMWRDNLRGVPEAQRQPVVGQQTLPAIEQAAQAVAATPVVQPAPAAQATQQRAPPTDIHGLIDFVAAQQGQPGVRNGQLMHRHLVQGASLGDLAKETGVSRDRIKAIKKNFIDKMDFFGKQHGLDYKQMLPKFQTPEAQVKAEEAMDAGLHVAEGRKDTGLTGVNSNGPRSVAAVEKNMDKLHVVGEDTVHAAWLHYQEQLGSSKLTPAARGTIVSKMDRLGEEIKRRMLVARTEGSSTVEEGEDVTDEGEHQDGELDQESQPEKKVTKEHVKPAVKEVSAPVETEEPIKPAPKRILRKAKEAAGPTPSKKEGEARASPATPETSPKSTLEQASEAWDANRAKDHPTWRDLTASQQKTFADYGEANWTKDDVANEAGRIAPKTAATPLATPYKPPLTPAGRVESKAAPLVKPNEPELGIANPRAATPKANAERLAEKDEGRALNPAESWSKIMTGVPHVPEFRNLPEAIQKEWVALDPEDRTRAAAAQLAQMSEGDVAQRSEQRKQDALRERVETVRRELRATMGFLNPAKIQIVQQVDEIPQAIRKEVEKTGPLDKTQGFVHNGKAWMVASNINKGDAFGVFLHEVGTHIGLESMLTNAEHGHLVDMVKDWASRTDGSLEAQVGQAARARLYSADVNAKFKDNELLAYAVEEASRHVGPTLDAKSELGQWLSRVWLMFRNTLDKLGWHVKEKPTVQDLVDLAYAAARMEMGSRFQEREGTQRSFIGLKSELGKSADNMVNAVVARMMYAQASTAEEIWKTTGWIKGAEGKWRMELPDENATVSRIDELHADPDKTLKLDEVLHHPRLFKAYPELRHVTVRGFFHDGVLAKGSAQFNPYGNEISVGKGVGKDTEVSMLLHEIQHWIQEEEDFARGGNPTLGVLRNPESLENLLRHLDQQLTKEGTSNPLSRVAKSVVIYPVKRRIAELLKLHEEYLKDHPRYSMELFNKYLDLFDKEDAIGTEIRYGLYRMLAGEVEAHNVQGRLNFTEQERKEKLPLNNVLPINQIVVMRSVRAEHVIEALPPAAQPLAKGLWTTIRNATLKGVNVAALTDDLIDMARKALPSVDRYKAAEQARTATRLEHESKIDRILQQYDHLPHAERGQGGTSVNRFIYDSTSQGKWGYRLDPQGSFEPDPLFAQRFRKFSAQGQQLIRDVFQYGRDTLREEKDAITTIANEVYANDPDKKTAFLNRYNKLLALDSRGPYSPLKRFGDYVVVGKSRLYEDAVGTNDQKMIEQLQDDPNHYHVEFAESAAEAASIRDQIKSTFPNAEWSEREATEALRGSNGGLFQAMGRLRNMLNQLDDGKAVADMQGLLRDMELRILAETSARKTENPRKNISGANRDMLRAFATQGRANAYFLSTMKHNEDVVNALDAMREDAKRPGNREDGMRYYNEFLRRHAQSFKYDSPMWQNRIKRLTSFWMLATSPAFYFQQLTQTYVMTAPYLAGKHGFFKTEKAIMRAYRDVFPMMKDSGVQDRPDFNLLPADVREMIQTLASHGKIDLGIDIEMGSWVKRGTDPGLLNKTMGRVDKLTRGLTSAVETLNRTTAAIAAYRMEKSHQMAQGKDERTAHDIATRYAEKTVHVTHGSYDGFNTPRLLSTAFPGARMITQFRRYQIVQLSMLARLFHNSLKGATKEERMVARRAMMFTLGHAFLLTGATGTPGVAALAYVAGKLFQGDDEPDTEASRELALRKAIGDEDLANLLIRGAPSAFGLDMSQKLGFNNTFSLTPFVQSDPLTKKGFADTVLAMLGPSFSLASKQVDGIDQMRHGEFYKGLEQAVPNGVGNALKGMRFSSQGITLRNGDVVLPPEEVSFFDGITQALGLPSTSLTMRSWHQGVKMSFEQFYAQKSGEVKADYMRAYKANDAAAMSDAREQWSDLQESRRRNGFKAEPFSALIKSPQAQAKRERQTEGGVEYRPNNRAFVDDIVHPGGLNNERWM